MSRFKPILFGLAWALIASQAQAGSLRCASHLISIGDRKSEVLDKCGEPLSRDVVGYQRSVDRRVEVQIEEWVYPQSGGMVQYLRFVGGRLERIDSKRGN
ncbi:hypothetical protein AWM79_18360 [Pseudomonas agarici]|uniref:DUF2845 domain-containing protein n=1 Tax=Pseudomonas agarici TaxID=46677 RepID=A0A0X1T529_PSEAA|nr:DUF2845 domain-containing protein [Pseudomonas agarici]AMB87158.1 hypothetical protein AWM79_18360 [Pseudomonas agarici]